MSHVFLSYSRADIETAKELAAALESSGLQVWWDRTIAPGKTFDEVIEEALDNSSWAVVLWSQDSVKSNWVKAEAEEALRRGTLVPVMIEEGIRPPLAFRRIEAAELYDWHGDSNHPEFRHLLEVLGGQAPPQPLPGPRAGRSSKSSAPAASPVRSKASGPGMATGAKIALAAIAALLLILVTAIATNPGIFQSRDSGEPPRRAVTEAEPERVAKPENFDPPPARRAPTSGTIVLRYTGDAFDCGLDLRITVGAQTITPSTNVVSLDVPLGPVDYAVNGTIACPGVGICSAAGSGALNAVDGAVYDLVWQNTTFGQCSVSLVQGG